ncbi:MAG: hypothetical protein ACYC6Y_17860 [Thermoguttaceae bacterium]
MQPTRRRFLAAGLTAVGTRTFLGSASAEEAGAIECLDYGRSFICNTAAMNAVRFWIESRTILYDDTAGTQLTIYQCGSCKSENTFAEKDLLQADNYDFMPIYGGRHILVLRRHADVRDRYRQVAKVEEMWGEPQLRLKYGSTVTELKTFEEIRQVAATDTPLAAQTEIRNEETGLRCLLEYPVKTMNVSIDKQVWQVDTGPIALPDLARRYEPPVDSARLAFAAFNAPDFCDFVIEQPTPVLREGQEACLVYHYSNPISLAAKNRVLAVT